MKQSWNIAGGDGFSDDCGREEPAGWLMWGGADCHARRLDVMTPPGPGRGPGEFFFCRGCRLNQASHTPLSCPLHAQEHPCERTLAWDQIKVGRMKLVGPQEVKLINLKPCPIVL